jgi:hypothetical protein
MAPDSWEGCWACEVEEPESWELEVEELGAWESLLEKEAEDWARRAAGAARVSTRKRRRKECIVIGIPPWECGNTAAGGPAHSAPPNWY